MATQSTIDFILDQLHEVRSVRARKMFGAKAETGSEESVET
jgi:hypothetical protein